ncbi:transcriptional regulator, TetR family [Lentibacillus halodurans]|uniref:Transcriptional regulator, TetR family n=1 Tax=Lentibacillus halodurans TaxID=237679 RepID=A0A1I0ZVT2_9BACI|nr:TetR/AcrR family transcriptional regulator [Lentibacillus halodurans]SFB29176.1 transcriptional regulator, TetR family [Lentibacillus halodurans]
MSTSRKDIQRARMWRYFLDAAVDVIEKEGIRNVTIRKIAGQAGFTSSTAYNYFRDLSHLKFFAAMRFTTDYIEDLPVYMSKGSNTIEKWLYAWKCFCIYSFEQPEIYSVIFMEDLGSTPEDFLDEYYRIYKEDLIGLPEVIKNLVMEHSFAKRSATYIQSAVDEEMLEQKDVDFIADITLMIWKGMINTMMNKRREFTKEEAIEKTLLYVYESVMHVIPLEKQFEINVDLQL